MADCTAVKRPAQRKGKSSPKAKRRRVCPQKERDKSKERGRVDIGPAFEPWRALRAARGLRSDAEVALILLDVTEKVPSRLASPGAADAKSKISQSKMQKLIEQEVHAAVQKKESKLQSLLESIQQLDRAVDYESSLHRLETRITTVTKRAEAAIAFMTKTREKSPLPSFVNVKILRDESEDETMETTAHNGKKSSDESGEVFDVMENTKEALRKMHADNDALKGATADLSEQLPPPVLTPHSSPDVKGLIKVEEKKPKEEPVTENHVEEPEQWEEPKVGPVKVECLPLCESNSPEHTDPEQEKPLYPPLPINSFPSTLHMEAALYNIPQKPEVRLALIRNPAGLSVLWNIEEEEPSSPPMSSYSIFMTVEKVKESNVFPDWTLAEVEAKPLPMCMMISKYKPGRKVCVAVVGKDKFGRFGPYSNVVTASLPE